MARTESWFEQDLKKPVVQRYIKGNFFSLDNVGNLVGVKVYDNGAEATLSGSVTGYCVLADGTTVPVTGTRSGNQAYILLPQSALSIPGYIGITLKLVDGSTITTLLNIIATVYPSQTDDVITPSQQVITDWAQQINTALQNVVDASAAQDQKIADLKSAFASYKAFGSLKIANGAVNAVTGTVTKSSSSTTRAVLADYIQPESGIIRIVAKAGYSMMPYAYNGDTYVGHLATDGHSFVKTNSNFGWVTEYIIPNTDYKYQVMIKADSNTSFTPSDYGELDAYYVTDKSFINNDVPADAYETGEYIRHTMSALSATEIMLIDAAGYIQTDGTTIDVEAPVAHQNWTHAVKNIEEGETFYITGVSGENARLWCFADADGNVLSVADAQKNYYNQFIEAPEDATYIIVNSYNNRSILYYGIPIRKQVESRTQKLHVCSWNIGNYNYGRLVTEFPRQHGILKSKMVREFLRDEFPDILVLTEFYHIDLTDGVTTINSRDDIKSLYRYYFKRNELVIASNWPITNGRYALFTTQADGQSKEWSKAELFIKKKRLLIFACHFASGTANTNIRTAQYQEIMSYIGESDTAIIMGDFNSYNISQMDVWTQNGYRILNGGYNGVYLTCPAISPTAPLDNIVIKGNNIYGVGYPHKAIYDSDHADDRDYYVADHLPLMADVQIS